MLCSRIVECVQWQQFQPIHSITTHIFIRILIDCANFVNCLHVKRKKPISHTIYRPANTYNIISIHMIIFWFFTIIQICWCCCCCRHWLNKNNHTWPRFAMAWNVSHISHRHTCMQFPFGNIRIQWFAVSFSHYPDNFSYSLSLFTPHNLSAFALVLRQIAVIWFIGYQNVSAQSTI